MGSKRVSFAVVNINKNLLGSLFYTHFVHGQLPVIWKGQQITIIGKRFNMLTEFEMPANKFRNRIFTIGNNGRVGRTTQGDY